MRHARKIRQMFSPSLFTHLLTTSLRCNRDSETDLLSSWCPHQFESSVCRRNPTYHLRPTWVSGIDRWFLFQSFWQRLIGSDCCDRERTCPAKPHNHCSPKICQKESETEVNRSGSAETEANNSAEFGFLSLILSRWVTVFTPLIPLVASTSKSITSR